MFSRNRIKPVSVTYHTEDKKALIDFCSNIFLKASSDLELYIATHELEQLIADANKRAEVTLFAHANN